jgi:long-chain acyl-CoA synthetase
VSDQHGVYERKFIDTYADRWPDKAAVVMAGSGEALSYRRLNERSNQFAHAIRGAGLGRGGHVAYLIENSTHCFEVIWGAYRAGCYFTPINTRLTAEEAAYIVRDCGADLLVASSAFAEVAEQLAELVPEIGCRLGIGAALHGYEHYEDVVRRQPVTPIPDESTGSRMYYTSGTTGRPKGVMRPLPATPLGARDPWLEKLSLLYGWSSDTVYLCPAPLYHGAGLWWTMAMHQLGATVVVMEKFDPEAFLAAVEKYRVSCLQVVPTMFIRLLRLPDAVKVAFSRPGLTHAIHAGAPCPIAVKEAMLEWWGPVIYEYYASTEGIGYCWIPPAEWRRHKGSVGRPVQGIIHIVGDDGAELPPGEPGVVYFEGPAAAFRYHNDERKTAESHHPRGWATAGDMGYADHEGYLYLTDRKAHMIISGGVNIYPQEAENLLAGHPLVDDVAVIGVPNPEWGEEVKAVVVPASGQPGDAALEQQLIDFCRDNIAHYKCPRSVDFVTQLPRTENGKLYKRQLREHYRTGLPSRIV